MKILLINPNRSMSPPVPPIGLEYIAGCLSEKGHMVEIADLCFSEDIYHDLEAAVKSFSPDIAGINVRNIDSVLCQDNQFYLDDIREIVCCLKSAHGLRVLIGGTGLMAGPGEVLGYLEADYAFVGPAEEALPEFLINFENAVPTERIYYGHCRPGFACPRRYSAIDYDRYYQAGGVAGFETHKGCSSSCIYCLEANSRVAFKRPKDVVREIRGVVDKGQNHFHLCDPEFNEDLDFSLAFCDTLKSSGMDLKWALYMKPANYNRKLFRLMEETGVYLITLTVDSFNKCSMYWADVEKIVFNAQSNGISIAIDFLTGFPYEEESVLSECLDLFRRVQPDVVNINTYIRLYKTLRVTHTILKDNALQPYLLGALDDETMLRPVFYNHVKPERLEELIKGEKLFKIAGSQKGVNYSNIPKNL